MEIQWPLVIFTLLICLSAGLFAGQGLLACLGKGRKLQLPTIIISGVCAAIGGLASFLHLENPLRIFNGFAQLSSGITQEIIAVIVMVIVMAIYFVFLLKARKNGNAEGRIVPLWVGILAIISAVLLVVVMTHSYMMSARPIWDGISLYLFYLTNTVLFGALGIWLIASILGEEDSTPGAAKAALVGVILNALALVAYVIQIAVNSETFTEVGYYFDPVAPTVSPKDTTDILSQVLTGEFAFLFWGLAILFGVLIPAVFILLKLKKNAPSTSVSIYAGAALICALVGAIAFRVVLYEIGYSVFIFY